MKIFITTPDFSVHGGIRIILEWANRLTHWHDVYLWNMRGDLRPDWFQLSPRVSKANLIFMRQCDLLIITSPHTIHLLDHPDRPAKALVFMQMCEDMFKPRDFKWQEKCRQFYTAPVPMIAISRWNIERIGGQYGRTGATHYVGNGVNLEDFPITRQEKDGMTVLVEGWESLNATKDIDGIGPQVAARLKKLGYRIVAYSQAPLSRASHVPDEYHHRPDLARMNDLYARATILLKASRFDARSCAPMEAMTKGTPTVRAIELGDDDLLDGYNCLRAEYGVVDAFNRCLEILQHPEVWIRISENCYHHLRANSWDVWMPRINDIITSL